jgi:hypothetical protein
VICDGRWVVLDFRDREIPRRCGRYLRATLKHLFQVVRMGEDGEADQKACNAIGAMPCHRPSTLRFAGEIRREIADSPR